MMKKGLLALAILAAVALVGATAGCGGDDKASTSSEKPSASSTPSTSSETPQPTSAAAEPADYTGLLITASDIPGTETWTSDPPKQNPDGTPGAEVAFTNDSKTRAIDVIIQVWRDPAQAQLALTGGKDSLPKVVTGTPQAVDVGTGGTLVSGTKPDRSQALAVLVFTEGKTFVDMVFAGATDDPPSTDMIIALGRKQADAIRDGLPA